MAGWVRKWNVGQGSLLAKWGKAPVPDTPLAQEGEDKECRLPGDRGWTHGSLLAGEGGMPAA